MRLVNADKLLENQYRIDDSATLSTRDVVNVEDIEDAPTVEAIPKADYENRLKADMVAMLTELMVDMADHIKPSNHTESYEDGWSEGAEWCVDYIQQKINELKSESGDNNVQTM